MCSIHIKIHFIIKSIKTYSKTFTVSLKIHSFNKMSVYNIRYTKCFLKKT